MEYTTSQAVLFDFFLAVAGLLYFGDSFETFFCCRLTSVVIDMFLVWPFFKNTPK